MIQTHKMKDQSHLIRGSGLAPEIIKKVAYWVPALILECSSSAWKCGEAVV